jgi:iron complex outermembrane receptor protein
LPIEVIKKLKLRPTSRVFGQNAFTGAVNIVTKDSLDNDASLRLQAGSYGQFSAAVTAGVSLNESNHILHFQKTYLTDIATIRFRQSKFCVEECFNKNKLPITMLVALSEKSLGQMVLCFASGY